MYMLDERQQRVQSALNPFSLPRRNRLPAEFVFGIPIAVDQPGQAPTSLFAQFRLSPQRHTLSRNLSPENHAEINTWCEFLCYDWHGGGPRPPELLAPSM